jgi:signal peptidase I
MEGASMASGKNSNNQKTESNWKESVILYLHDLLYMLTAVLLVFLLLFRVIVVSGDSMYSTLLDGDYLLLLGNLFYQQPEHGDIVVISKQSFDNGKPIVKRVIATEGQTVDIDFEHAIVYVDGVALEEPYINSPTSFNEGMVFPLTVAEDCIFVLGDNRGVSRDSRDPLIGQIDKREVLGKAMLLILPGTSHGNLSRDFGRIGVIE